MTTESPVQETRLGEQSETRGVRLPRSLGVWQVLGLSIGLMGLSLSANINPQGAAPVVGRAIPLTFAIATFGVLLVGYGFARLSQRYSSAGSVLGLVGATLGVRAGTVAAWSLLGAYTIFGITSAIGAGLFGGALLQSLGVVSTAPAWSEYVITLAVLIIATALAIIPARRGTSLLLILEACTVTLILLISAVVLVKLFAHSAPGGQRFTWSIFKPEHTTGTSGLFLGVVFGFLSFAGFEAAATSGSEARNPGRDIPRAIIGTVVIGGLFYTFASGIEVLGFGTSAKQLADFQNSGSLFGTLGTRYLASWVGDVVTVGTIISAFGGALASIAGGSRLWYSLTDSAVDRPNPLVRVSARWGTPTGAILTAAVISCLITALFAWILNFAVLNTFTWLGTVATLLMLVIYILVTLGAAWLLFFSGDRSLPRRELIIPLAGIVVLGYTIYRNVIPYPTGPLFWLPIAAGGWILIAVVAVLLFPGLSRRISAGLSKEVDLTKRVEVEGSHDAVPPQPTHS
ncbi:MAG: APC family permease [Solirubrobacterales bacterium]|nr:APC family permease [Solirubrobacterales bacterium]